MIKRFIDKGYEKVDFENIADIYVINTCTVTNMSDKKSRQIIRKAKRLNEKGIVVVTGCYAEISKDKIKKILEVNLIIGNNDKKDIVEIVEEYVQNRRGKHCSSDIPNSRKAAGD